MRSLRNEKDLIPIYKYPKPAPTEAEREAQIILKVFEYLMTAIIIGLAVAIGNLIKILIGA